MCATSRRFNHSPSRRAAFALLNGTSALASTATFRSVGCLSCAAWSRRIARRGDDAWAIEQILRHDWPQVLAAGTRSAASTRPTGFDVDVLAAVVVTLDDEIVATKYQLADAVAHATRHEVGHAACSLGSSRSTDALIDACGAVTGQRTATLIA